MGSEDIRKLKDIVMSIKDDTSHNNEETKEILSTVHQLKVTVDIALKDLVDLKKEVSDIKVKSKNIEVRLDSLERKTKSSNRTSFNLQQTESGVAKSPFYRKPQSQEKETLIEIFNGPETTNEQQSQGAQKSPSPKERHSQDNENLKEMNKEPAISNEQSKALLQQTIVLNVASSPDQQSSKEKSNLKEINKGPATTNEQLRPLKQTEVLLKAPSHQQQQEKENHKAMNRKPVTFIEEPLPQQPDVSPPSSPQPQSQSSAGAQGPQKSNKHLSTFYTAGPFSASSINGVLQLAIEGRPINIQQAKLISEDGQMKTLQPPEVPEARILLPKDKNNVIILEYRGYHFETTDNGKERIFTTKGNL